MSTPRAAIAPAHDRIIRPRQVAAPRARDWLPLLATLGGAVGAAALQICIGVWWASALNERVDAVEKNVASLAPVPATLARLDERSLAQGQQLDHLVAQQDRIARRQ